jgi:hypothetical protein
MTRLPDWQERFSVFVQSRQAIPFAWGTNDCCTFAASCVQAITGHNPLPAHFVGHTTRLRATRVLLVHGGLANAVTGVLGPSINPLFSQIGDVILLNPQDGPLLGICNGSVVFAPSANGLVLLPLTDATAAWRIG